MSGIAKELTLEQLAHNDGYDKLDINGSRPESRCCHQGAPAFLMSGIDMSRVCDAVKESSCGVDAVLSFDPGRLVLCSLCLCFACRCDVYICSFFDVVCSFVHYCRQRSWTSSLIPRSFPVR